MAQPLPQAPGSSPLVGQITGQNRAWAQWTADFGDQVTDVRSDQIFQLVRHGQVVGQVSVAQSSALGVAVAHVEGAYPEIGDTLVLISSPPDFNQTLRDRYPLYRSLYGQCLRTLHLALLARNPASFQDSAGAANAAFTRLAYAFQDMPETRLEFLGGYRSFWALNRAINDLNAAFPAPVDAFNPYTGLVGSAYDPAYYDQALAATRHDYAEAEAVYNTDQDEWSEVRTQTIYH
ncbi:MAG: hypothetical protein ACYCW6_26905 [Candidatus Xenobia bacterium]